MNLQGDEWCILRTSGSTTLRLAESLGKDGYEVWTPIETRTMRVPRANVRRTVKLAIMPSYIFAKAHHLVDLLTLAAMPVKPRRGAGLREPAHANFSVLHCFGGIPLVPDAHLNRLRALQAKLTPVKKADRAFPRDVAVKVEGGSFGGMIGKVEKSDTTHTLVCFGGKFSVKVLTSILQLDDIGDTQPLTGTAARKAA
jgi:hypothetical protein